MNSQSYKELGQNLLQALGTILLILVVVGVGSSIRAELGKRRAATPKSIAESPMQPAGAPISWQRQTFAGLSVDVPLRLTRDAVLEESLHGAFGQHTSGTMAWLSSESNNFGIAISTIYYVNGMGGTIDDVARGAIRGEAAAAGDNSPRFRIMPTTISGMPARQATYDFQNGSGLRLQVLCTARGSRLWIIAVTCKASSPWEKDATRMLRSAIVAAP